ncbi:hypothetical protein JZ751_020867 [Albula glossodonta]|uniref:Uncharacterized protein n=1 Tax=Albula glossodonta TaxID=121402 RepID=A0A8T2PGJ3_9TELE|nr:hypothetical protein JZ751_020867 [Albula glossodonta]
MGITLRLLRGFLLHSPLVTGTSNPIEVGRNDSKADELALLCRKEELKFGHCLVNWLKCYYKKDCGREHMLMKLICSDGTNREEVDGIISLSPPPPPRPINALGPPATATMSCPCRHSVLGNRFDFPVA